MPRAIPDRWIPYKACGSVIAGTRIVCFKVPLRKNVQQGVKEIKEIWDIEALLRKLPKLAAVIDLTNTMRYYNPNELIAAGVLYKKILMPGRVIPPEDKVLEFMDTVDEILNNNSDALLGVHCTHGLNRTGYMVCRYLRDRLGMPGNVAIKKFEKARGYQIERDNYKANILGENVPPPEIGCETEIKPFVEDNTVNYNNSMNDYKDNYYDSNRWQYKMRNRSEYNRSQYNRSQYNRSQYNRSQYNRSSGSQNQGNVNRSRRGSKSDKSLSTRRNYDYKYDY